MPVVDNKPAINATICLLELVVLEGPSLPGWSVDPFTWRCAEKGSIFSLKKKPWTSKAPHSGRSVASILQQTVSRWRKRASGTSTGHMVTPETRRRFEKCIRKSHVARFDLHITGQDVKTESENSLWASNSANNGLACNETGSVCISEEFHVLLAIKTACKVALKVN